MGSNDKFVFTLRGGLKMPALGLGTYAPKEDDEDVLNAVHAAVKIGYRHLDCAAIYRNERAIGSAIRKLIIEGTVEREDLFITSKLWNTCHRPDLVRASLKKSLDDLGIKYLDMYLIHWPMAYKEGEVFDPKDENGKIIFSDVDYVDTWRALEDCVDEGLVRNIGVSNFSSKQLQRVLDIARIKPQLDQVECHIHLANTKLLNYCQENGVVLQAYAPLGSSGNKKEPPPTCLEEPVLLEIAKAKNKTPAQVTLRFLLQRGVSVVPKSVRPERIQENFQIFDFELSADEMKQLQNLNKDHRLHVEEIFPLQIFNFELSADEMKQLLDLNKDYRLITQEVAIDHKYYTFNDPF